MQARSPDVLKTSKEFARDLSVPERTQANHEEMNFHFSRPHTVLSVLLSDEVDTIFFTDEVYEFVSCTAG